MAKKKTPAINSSSTADIAFLLLCYFLMTTTMGSQTGLSRLLPPMPDPNQKIENQQVNQRNIILVRVNAANNVLAGSEPIAVSQLKDKIKDFLSNPYDDPSLPAKTPTEIEGYGTYNVSQGVISLQNDRGTSYYQYIAVQNEIVKAIDELRDEFAMSNYGRPYIRLTEDQQDIVKKAIPQRISEAEPKDVSQRR
ncbi:MAG: biopolymer transporter ExbD [Bacteroidales bacterium]|nr:biopolymer transporter ExbD [Bacteroidales bacterium]MBR3284934.1 biopolymer transporter ExbD [Bacteroidales bacterium]MBR5430837.1 biopolymer transporter ExbD [Bacteroidales bacterium]